MDRASTPYPAPGWWLGPALSRRQVLGRCAEGTTPGPFSMPGLSENNPPVQVIPTPAPLVPHFQVLLLDPLKVLQQLCVVDAQGVCVL